MVDPQNTTMPIDTGQDNDRYGFTTQEIGCQQQQIVNLVENSMKNRDKEQKTSQSQNNVATVEGTTTGDDQRIDQEINTRRENRDKEKRGLTIAMEFQGEVNEEECFEAIIKVTLELV